MGQDTNLDDLRFESWGRGVPKMDGSQGPPFRGVKVTHIPTGITAECDTEKSQVYNKAEALRMLEAKLAEA